MVSYRRRRYTRRRPTYRRRRVPSSRRRRRTFRRRRRTTYRRRRTTYRRRRRTTYRRRGVSFSTGTSDFGSKRSRTTSKVFRASVPAIAFQQLVSGSNISRIMKNPLQLFNTPYIAPDAATFSGPFPRTFPPVTNGLFCCFSLDTYINCIARAWLAYRPGFAVGDLPDSNLGSFGTMHPDELALRRLMSKNVLFTNYKIRLIFRRRLRTATANSTVIPTTFEVGDSLVNVPQGEGLISNGNITVDQQAWIPTSYGNLPWYCQYVKGIYQTSQFCANLTHGFSFNDFSDPIIGNTASHLDARVSRILTEMSSGKSWEKRSGAGDLIFEITSRKGVQDYVAVSEWAANRTYTSPSTNQIDNSNYHETMSPMYVIPSFFSEQTVPSGNYLTHPSVCGPSGTCFIWIPYSIEHLRAYYDISVEGYFKFQGEGTSILDARARYAATALP